MRHHALAAHGVRELVRERVQRQAPEPEAVSKFLVVFALAIAHVANQRVADVLQVAPDLMQATGERRSQHQ